MNNYLDKLNYLQSEMIPKLEEAFKRGDSKYVGIQHSHDPRILNRTPVEDINHVRNLHVDVRLREAEEAADNNDLNLALSKIESAIGYLIILHMRTKDKIIGISTPIGYFKIPEHLIDKFNEDLKEELHLLDIDSSGSFWSNYVQYLIED